MGALWAWAELSFALFKPSGSCSVLPCSSTFLSRSLVVGRMGAGLSLGYKLGLKRLKIASPLLRKTVRPPEQLFWLYKMSPDCWPLKYGLSIHF